MSRSPLFATALLTLAAALPVHAQPAATATAPTAPAATPMAPAAPAAMAAPTVAPRNDAAPAAAARGDVSEGKLAWYGRKFNGRVTASGERYRADAMTMAHKSLPFGTLVKVTNTANKRSVTLRVNDRGPTAGDRVGDVSQAGAQRLGMRKAGLIDARLEVVGTSRNRTRAVRPHSTANGAKPG